MANECFKVTQIFKRFRKGFRQYPFSIGSFVSAVPGSDEIVIGTGVIPDGTSIYVERGVPLSDEQNVPELSLSAHIDPLFIYNGDLSTGLRENI